MGGRRVGKTTILYQLRKHIQQEDHQANIIFLDKELHEFKHIRNNEDLYTYVNARMLSSDLATYLTGRYIEFRINALSYSEFLQFLSFPTTLPAY